LGAVFASRVGHSGTGTLALAHAGRLHVISGVHAVFIATAPLALLALVVVLALKEVPLRAPSGPAPPAHPEPAGARRPVPAGATR
jgi:hypothetical protein